MADTFLEFLDMSPEELYKDWLTFITTRDPLLKDTSLASFNSVLAEAVASEFWIFLQLLKQKVRDSNLLTAEGDALTDLAKQFLPEGRRPGTRATGVITFTRPSPAPSDITIPAGTICAAMGDDGELIEFETTETVVLSKNYFEVHAPARAVQAGCKGNVNAGTIRIIRTPVVGVTACVNDSVFTGGTDQESDEELRHRAMYSIWVNGRATTPVVQEHLDALEGVWGVKVETLYQGDVLIVIDCDPSDLKIRQNIHSALYDNLAAGIVASGVLGATLRPNGHTLEIGDTPGTPVWVRTLQAIPSTVEVHFTYKTPSNTTATGYATIPAGSLPGSAVPAEMDPDAPLATKITGSIYTGQYSFDVLLGYGTYPFLWTIPEIHPVNVSLVIKLSPTAEVGLVDKIKKSLTGVLNEYSIGEAIEYADIVKYIYVDYHTGHAFQGIDDVVSFSITCKDITIDTFGEKIILEDDERAKPGTVNVSLE